MSASDARSLARAFENLRVPDWYGQAQCAGADTGTFFGRHDRKPILSQDDIQTAKTICNACPVQNECLAWAISTDESHGIWGGKTRNERRAIIRRIKNRYAA